MLPETEHRNIWLPRPQKHVRFNYRFYNGKHI